MYGTGKCYSDLRCDRGEVVAEVVAEDSVDVHVDDVFTERGSGLQGAGLFQGVLDRLVRPLVVYLADDDVGSRWVVL